MTPWVITRVRNGPGVARGPRRISLRSKTRATWSGRPMSRLSRMTCSKNIRPETGLSSSWVKRELGLQNRQLVAVARGPIRSGERVRHVIASNLPFGSGAVVIGASQAHLVHVSTLSGPGIGPDIQPVIRADRWRCGHRPRFPAAFRLLALACWTIPRPLRTSASLTVGPPDMTARPTTGLPRSTRTSPTGVGAPYTPGRRCSLGRLGFSGRRLPLPSGQSYPPATTFHRRGPRDEASSGVHSHSPVRSSPHL